MTRRTRWSMACILAAALAVRLLASRGDLWLDEIISVALARVIAEPWDVVFAADARTDNNHLLNTLWLFAVGDADPVVQRLHSVIAATVSCALAYVFARRWGAPAAVAAAALFGGSFFLITYGSEARGYAMLVAFALLALSVMDRTLGQGSGAGFAGGQTGVRPGSDRGHTGLRPGSHRGHTGVRPGSDRGQTGVRPASDRCSTGVGPGSDRGLAGVSPTGVRAGSDRGQMRGGPVIVFWAACVLGTLAHMLFLEVFLGLLAWSIWHLRAQSRVLRALLFHYYLVPAAFMAWLYVVFIRPLQILGAEPSHTPEVMAQTASYLLGLPRGPFWAWVSFAVLIAIVGFGVRELRRRGDDAWVLMVMLCVGAPAIVMTLVPPAFVLPRYFIIPAVGVLLTAALLLGRLLEQGAARRAAAMGVLAALIIANSVDTANLLRNGRGQYSRALHEIAASTTRPVIRIGGDHAFRQATVIAYHRKSLPPATSLEYVADDRLRDVAPDWVVTHSFDPQQVPPASIQDPFGRGYTLWRTYPTGPLSGWCWHVYRRE